MTTSQLTTPTENPTRFKPGLKHLIWLTIIVGIVVSAYLSWVKFTEEPLAYQLFGIRPQVIACSAESGFNCEAVQKSVYSRFLGVPIAYLGLAMYLTVGGILLLEKRVPFLAENGNILLFGIGLFGWLFSMWLVYIQAAVLQALCQWCLLHEINMTILFPALAYRLWQSLREQPE